MPILQSDMTLKELATAAMGTREMCEAANELVSRIDRIELTVVLDQATRPSSER